MALKLRLARLGRKKTPIYAIVVADSRAPRDGNYIEKVGNYDPRQPKDSAARIVMNAERVNHWISVGAQPTDRVAVMLGKIGLAPAPAKKNNPQKAIPKAKAQERAKERADKAAAAAEAAAAPAEAPAAE